MYMYTFLELYSWERYLFTTLRATLVVWDKEKLDRCMYFFAGCLSHMLMPINENIWSWECILYLVSAFITADPQFPSSVRI